jgi:hypothetical protein
VLSPTEGLIIHVLRTRAPLSSPKGFSFDLHVLGPPQTFALSQDQTLQFDLAEHTKCSMLVFVGESALPGLCSLNQERAPAYGDLDFAAEIPRVVSRSCSCSSVFRERCRAVEGSGVSRQRLSVAGVGISRRGAGLGQEPG